MAPSVFDLGNSDQYARIVWLNGYPNRASLVLHETAQDAKACAFVRSDETSELRELLWRGGLSDAANFRRAINRWTNRPAGRSEAIRLPAVMSYYRGATHDARTVAGNSVAC
jgi:hypothetical protein